MGIFGRSNKIKLQASQFQDEYKSTHDDLKRTIPPSSHSNWYYVEQQPNISNGYIQNSTSPKGWIVPINPSSRFQPYPAMSPLLPQRPSQRCGLAMLKLQSVPDLLSGDMPSYIPGASLINNGVSAGTHHLHHQGVALYDLISSKLCSVVTLIDEERFSGDDRELVVYQRPQPKWHPEQQLDSTSRDLVSRKEKLRGITKDAQSCEITYTNYFSRVNDYANSKLPTNLPPMKLYMSTYPLLCLAAQYSERVYTKPSGEEKETRVNAGRRIGTVMKSVPIDDMDIIVFAIRGTQTFMDWTVNVQTKPKSPEGFLDDTGNLCHAGFLNAAKDWIKPVAARLRHLLEENPSRARCSLLITGHSAGGAVAALLYSHMLSTSPEAESELNILTSCFKRVHCVTFGAPPVTLLPLTKPNNRLASKSIFMSFINEGDLVARAEFAYVRSLLDLLSTPAPGKSYLPGLKSKKSFSALAVAKKRHGKSNDYAFVGPVWEIPEATLSNAGSIVLLRGVDNSGNTSGKKLEDRMDDGVIAQMISDELLRGVVWGDPVCHMMKLYARRIEVLATNAVMGRA